MKPKVILSNPYHYDVELTTKQRLKKWFSRKLELWQELFDALLLDEPLFKIPKEPKKKGKTELIDKVYLDSHIYKWLGYVRQLESIPNTISDWWWWYFSKGAKHYRTQWGLRKNLTPKFNHFRFKELHWIANKIQGTTIWGPDYAKTNIIRDYKPGTDFIKFKNPPVIRLSRFDRIVKELTPHSAI